MPASTFTNTSNGTSTSVKGIYHLFLPHLSEHSIRQLGLSSAATTSYPNTGAYNVLYCRPGTYLSFSTGASTTNGLVVAMNAYFYSAYVSAGNTQTIFAIRDSSTNYVSLTAELMPSSTIQISQQTSSGTWAVVLTSPILTLGKFFFIVLSKLNYFSCTH